MRGSVAAASPVKQAVGACRTALLAVIAFSFCINTLMLTVPLYMLQIFDRVLSSRSTDTLLLLLALALLALLTMAVLEALRSILLNRAATWLDRRLSGAILAESVTSRLRRGEKSTVQGLRDLATVRDVLSSPAVFPLLDAPWTPIFLATLFLLHPLLGWLGLAGALILMSLAVLGEVATRGFLGAANAASTNALVLAESSLRNADAVDSMGMMSALLRRWDRLHGEAVALHARAGYRAAALTASSRFLRLALQIALFSLGAWLAIQGALTAGGMIAGSILLARALAPVDQAIGAWRRLIAAREAWRRVTAILANAAPPAAAMALPVPAGRLTVEGLSFAHPDGRKPMFHDLSFAVAPGQCLGLVGPSGAGKTTLAQLLIGNLRPTAGHVRLDGMDVSVWDRGDLGRHVGYLPQDVALFGATVRANIARMDEGDPAAVLRAAELAGAHEMILRLPRGYDTVIGPGGLALSGGHRQRIALARALYGDPRLLVLDEPDAHLDHEGLRALLRAMASLKRSGVTTVLIAHRAQVLDGADTFLMLTGDGRALHGPRDEVARKIGEASRARAMRTARRLTPVEPSIEGATALRETHGR